ncbi:heme-binding protein [Labrenzia sp. DG1229]|uniref:GlcG/HbpS family heme-binding protein n=1 Tax=Labrenzia sp. DG1229 TaxID=681847 RepID=UPI00048AD93E|nr:heme-binding protein [Labrenzia sp. DG1229]
MKFVEETKLLTHRGTMAILSAAVARAEALGQPQCIVVVDRSGEVLAEIRMTGAKFLSRKSALAKALTASSTGVETTSIPEAVRTHIGLATDGNITGLPGGLPIVLDGVLLGGIGVGSGSGDQDIDVASAGLSAIGA